MSADLVLFRADQTGITFAPEAQAMKDAALESGSLIGYVTDAASNQKAVEAMRQLTRVINLCERSRKKAIEPLLDATRRVNAKAKEFARDLEEELERIRSATSDFQSYDWERVRAEKLAKAKEEAARSPEENELLPIPEPVRTVAQGQVVRKTWDWEVTDIWHLAVNHPGLVQITPRRQEINDAIAKLADVGEPKIAGLTIRPVVDVSVRTRAPRTVEV